MNEKLSHDVMSTTPDKCPRCEGRDILHALAEKEITRLEAEITEQQSRYAGLCQVEAGLRAENVRLRNALNAIRKTANHAISSQSTENDPNAPMMAGLPACDNSRIISYEDP